MDRRLTENTPVDERTYVMAKVPAVLPVVNSVVCGVRAILRHPGGFPTEM